MVKFITLIIVAIIAIIVGGALISTCNETAVVAKKEFGPSALLKKYEYFKDLSAAIDKKRADIEMYKGEISESEGSEKNQLKAELRGIITMHNELCAEYNSAMSKFNYRFTNAGDLPASNLEPLPREIKPYLITTK